MIRQVHHAALIAVLLVATSAVSGRASATHKSWVLKNSGGQCVFDFPTGDPNQEVYNYGIQNGSSFGRSVTCPVALSARWGSSNPAWAQPLWAGAWGANVYVDKTTQDSMSCYVSGRFDSQVTGGSLYYSRTVATSGLGQQKLSVATMGSWGSGSGLENNEAGTLRALAFHCVVPSNYSGIDGYKVRICQKGLWGDDCASVPTDPDGDGEIYVPQPGFAGGLEWVQTSGIECSPESGNTFIQRGAFGIKNTGYTFAPMFCPIVPSADDTKEPQRTVTTVVVHFTGGVAPYPICQLTWRDRRETLGGTFWSSAFSYDPGSPGRVTLPVSNTPIGLDVYTAVWCDLPAQMTIKGVTTNLSVARVTGGN